MLAALNIGQLIEVMNANKHLSPELVHFGADDDLGRLGAITSSGTDGRLGVNSRFFWVTG